MNARVVSVFVWCALASVAFAQIAATPGAATDAKGNTPAATTPTPPPTTTPSAPKPTFKPEMYPSGTLHRHIHPPRMGLNHADFRDDVRYNNGGRPPTPEEAFAYARAVDPRVTADAVERRGEYVTPLYDPETTWDLYQHQQRRHPQRRVPVDLRPPHGRRHHRRHRRHNTLPPMPPELPPVPRHRRGGEDERIRAVTVYDAPESNVRVVRRKHDNRVEAHAVDALPGQWSRPRTVPAKTFEQPRTFSSHENVVIVGDIKQWVDRNVLQGKKH